MTRHVLPFDMPNVIEELAERLTREESLDEAFAAVDDWGRDGRVDDLVALWIALEARASRAGRGSVTRYEDACDHVEEVIALVPGPLALEAVFALLRRERMASVRKVRSPVERARQFASRLACGQPEASLDRVLAERALVRAEEVEVVACWLQELVLRGAKSLVDRPAVAAFRERLEANGHPLARLPLQLCLIEREAASYLPLYGADAIHRAVERLERGAASTRTIPPPHSAMESVVTRLSEPETEERLLRAIEPWVESGQGRASARVFALGRRVPSDMVGRWLLRRLPMECVADSDSLRVDRVEAEFVWGALFGACANGGAASTGTGGAYGRAAAWVSLGALVGEGPEAPIDRIEVTALRATFLSFLGSGRWFHDVAWDLGLLAVRPDGATVAVLAATDAE